MASRNSTDSQSLAPSQSSLIPCALYARYSPRPRDKDIKANETLQAQTERMEAYCRLRGLDPRYSFNDPLLSGRIPLSEREQGGRLVQLIAKGVVKHVVAQKLDRIFRNEVDGILTEKQWRRRGVALHLADQGGIAFDTKTATGRLIFKMLLVVAAFEPEQTSERTRAASQRYQNTGRRMSFVVPYGKMLDPDSTVRRLDKNGQPLLTGLLDNPDELAVIEQMRSWRAEGTGYRTIAKRLNEQAIAARHGGRWAPSVVMRILRRLREPTRA